MVGTKRFDEEQALQAVMEVFWRQGFERTSIDDLELATGLRRGSLYNAYGGKEAMFLKSLQRYSAAISSSILEGLAASDLGSAIDAVFARQHDALMTPGAPGGCCIATAAAEFGDQGGAAGRAVRDQVESAENAFYDRLVQAQAEGQVPVGEDVRADARFLLAIMLIVPILHRVTGDDRVAADIVRTAKRAFASSG